MSVSDPRSCSDPATGGGLLALESVSKTFSGGVEALKGLSLHVSQGDFMSLLGPSGCGKSTVLRLIAGLAEPSSGRVDWRSDRESGRVAFVFQEPTLMPWASVERNVWLPLRLGGRSFRAARDEIEQALGMVGLEPYAQLYPRELSGGMKMRVSIARALVTKPQVILMDEPFAALDEITRFKLNNDLLVIKERSACTILFVTHSVYESVFLSRRVAVMTPRPGRVFREIEMSAPYPRSDEFRSSNDYLSCCKEVSAALREAAGGAA